MKKIIGTGAAGNKAAIKIIEDGVVRKEDVLLINSTQKDIPLGYDGLFLKIGNGIGGAGKEREKGKQYLIDAINDGSLSRLDSFLDPEDDGVIIITSTEGGSGSGSAPILAQYFKDVVGTNVHIVAFTGLGEDPRDLSNTINFFKGLDETYTFEVICNEKFMEEYDNNKLKAENAANEELSDRINVLLGRTLVDCEQNIDPTDLYKVVNTPGLLTVETAYFKNLKNTKQFNDILNQMVDESKSIDINENGVLRLAVILNINEKSGSYIDYNFTALKNKLGIPFESFPHIQYTEDEESISIIASGMKLPEKEIQDMYEKYQELSNKVNTKKESFFENISSLNTSEASIFNVEVKKVNNDLDARRKEFLAGQGAIFEKEKDKKVAAAKQPTAAFVAKQEKY